MQAFMTRNLGCFPSFFLDSDIVAVQLSKFVDELLPVLRAHFNHGCVKTIVLDANVALLGRSTESTTEIVSGGLSVPVGAHDCHDEVSLALRVLH